jgi:hypothetical protein
MRRGDKDVCETFIPDQVRPSRAAHRDRAGRDGGENFGFVFFVDGCQAASNGVVFVTTRQNDTAFALWFSHTLTL